MILEAVASLSLLSAGLASFTVDIRERRSVGTHTLCILVTDLEIPLALSRDAFWRKPTLLVMRYKLHLGAISTYGTSALQEALC
jgi:hypothetical protein